MTMIQVRLLNLIIAFLLALNSSAVFAQATGQPSAGMTELDQNGHQLKSQSAILSDGVFTNTADVLRPNTYAKVLDNVHMIRSGVWSTRGTGYTIPGALPGAVQTLCGYCDNGGNDRILALCTGNIGCVFDPASGAADGVTGTYVSTSSQPTARPSWDTTGTVITNGNANPFYFGLNYPTDIISVSSNWPVTTLDANSYSGPLFNERYYDRHVYAGMGGFPNSLMISADSSTNSWIVSVPAALTDAGVLVVPVSLGHITGLYNVAQSTSGNAQTLLIACENGLACLTGSDPSTYAISTLGSNFGILSNHTWYSNDNDTYFLATDGIRKLTNTAYGTTFASSVISYPVQDLIGRVDNSVGGGAFVLPHSLTRELVFYFPVTFDSSDPSLSGDSGPPIVNPNGGLSPTPGSGQNNGGNYGGGSNSAPPPGNGAYPPGEPGNGPGIGG